MGTLAKRESLGPADLEKLVTLALDEAQKHVSADLVDDRRDPDGISELRESIVSLFAKRLRVFLKEETGYQWIQGTRPQTLSYGLVDSPVGLAALPDSRHWRRNSSRRAASGAW